jgi:hypothetical protein
MNNYKTKDLVWNNICLLIPLIIYGIYKNGYLLYEKNLINLLQIFKPLYLVLIGIIVLVIYDLIRYKKIRIDYNLVSVILIGMIVPYNINYFVYTVVFIILFIFTEIISKYINFNKVCFIYLVIILINFLFNKFTFCNPLELNNNYNFTLIDLFLGRGVGGISSTCSLLCLISYIFLLFNFYYKKDIPLFINITYIIFAFIYFLITKNSSILINNDLIFGSIFVSALPIYSPYKVKNQIIYGIIIGILAFIISIFFNNIMAIYIATFVMSIRFNKKILK